MNSATIEAKILTPVCFPEHHRDGLCMLFQTGLGVFPSYPNGQFWVMTRQPLLVYPYMHLPSRAPCRLRSRRGEPAKCLVSRASREHSRVLSIGHPITVQHAPKPCGMPFLLQCTALKMPTTDLLLLFQVMHDMHCSMWREDMVVMLAAVDTHRQ